MVAAAVVGSAVVGGVASSNASRNARRASDNATAAASAASERQAALAERQYDDYLQYYAPRIISGMDRAEQAAAAAEARTAAQFEHDAEQARRMSERYWGVQVPLEDQMIQQARTYNTEDERARMAAEARGDVAAAFDQSRGIALRNLERMGVNPNDGRYAATTGGLARDEALATASAANKTREAARQIGWSRLGEVAALGRGLPGFASTSSQVALGWNNAGTNAGMAGLSAAVAGSGAANNAAQTSSNIWGQSAGSAIGGADAYNRALGTAYRDPFVTAMGGIGGLALGYAGNQMGL